MKITNEIWDYVLGKMLPEDRHMLEKQALDDPFLGDALEGFSMYQKTGLPRRKESIERRFASRIHQKKRTMIKLWPYALAASFALLIAIGTLIRLDMPENQTVLLSHEKEPENVNEEIDLSVESQHEALFDQLTEWSEASNNAERVSRDYLSVEATDDKSNKTSYQDEAMENDASSDISALMPKEERDIALNPVPPSIPQREEKGIINQNTLEPEIPAISRDTRSGYVASDQVSTLVAPSALRTQIDTSAGTPEIGLDKVKEMNVAWRKNLSPEFFMRGIESGESVSVSFLLDNQGLPRDIMISPSMGDYFDQKAKEFIRSTGRWKFRDPERRIIYILYY